MITTKKITNSITRANSRNLKFLPSEPLTVVNREYGLMRVFNDRSMTPYPRASKGVDAETLRNRLSLQKHGDGSALMMLNDELQDIQRPTNTPPTVHIAISRMRHPPEHLLRGTPHPMKGKAVDPKLLIKNLESEKQSLQTVPSRVRGSTRGSIRGSRRSTFSGRSSINKYVPTPHPKKRIVLNPKSLIKRLTDINSESPSYVKKVGFLTPQQSFQSFDASQGSMSVTSDTNLSVRRKSLSFEERRRLFVMGEFTIAKNGKKLSGWPFSEASNPGDVRTSLLIDAEKANEEIELFMQKQGMAKAARNMVTNVRPGRRSQKRISTGSASSHLSTTKASSMISLSLPSGSVVSNKRRVQI